jgi:outer membrane protein, heavy metal efflux system
VVPVKRQSRSVAVLAVYAFVHAAQSTGAYAQEPRRVTLDEALALFGSQNLELQVARAEAAEAEGLAFQAAAYPNPTLTATHEPLSGGGTNYSESYLDVGQRLEWPATRAARRESAERAAAAARARLSADSARLAFQLKAAYVEALRAEETATVLDRVTGVFREAEDRAADRLREGDISEYDFRRIRVERARYETQLAEAELDAAAARRTLALLVAPDGADIEIAPAAPLASTPPEVDLEAVMAAARSRRREIVAAEAELDAAAAQAQLATRERIPDLTATAGFKRQSDGLRGAFLGLSVPLPLWDRRGGAIAAADARVEAARARLALTRRQVENDLRRATLAYASIVRRATLLAGPVAAEANDLVQIAQVAYDAGEMELIDVLDAAAALRDARAAEARLRADLWTGYYDLERAVGGLDGSSIESEDGR